MKFLLSHPIQFRSVKIGILVPLPQEMKPLSGIKIQSAHCEHITDNILVCQSGLGRKRAHAATQLLIAEDVDLLISWGSAAGLRPDVCGGDLLIPRSIKVNHQFYNTHNPFNQSLLLQVPENIVVHQGPICDTLKILVSVESKKKLFISTQCLAADMESATLAELAIANQIPFSVIRVVSDPVNIKLPMAVMSGLQSKEQFQVQKFLLSALVRPWEWCSIIKLARNFKKARKTLNIVAQLIKEHT